MRSEVENRIVDVLTDPSELVSSGVLAEFAEGGLSAEDARIVEFLMARDSTIQAAYDEILVSRAEFVQAELEGLHERRPRRRLRVWAAWPVGLAAALFGVAYVGLRVAELRAEPKMISFKGTTARPRVAQSNKPKPRSVVPVVEPFPTAQAPVRLIESLAASVVSGFGGEGSKGFDTVVKGLSPSQTVVSSDRPDLSWQAARWMRDGGTYEVRLRGVGSKEPEHVFLETVEAGQRGKFACPVSLERGVVYEWSVVPLIDPTVSVVKLPSGTIRAKFKVLDSKSFGSSSVRNAISGHGVVPDETRLGRPLARGIVLTRSGLIGDARRVLKVAAKSSDAKVAKSARDWLRSIEAAQGK